MTEQQVKDDFAHWKNHKMEVGNYSSPQSLCGSLCDRDILS